MFIDFPKDIAARITCLVAALAGSAIVKPQKAVDDRVQLGAPTPEVEDTSVDW